MTIDSLKAAAEAELRESLDRYEDELTEQLVAAHAEEAEPQKGEPE